MTPEEQRIAIAEACGTGTGIDTLGRRWFNGPDYLNDLNAMAQAENQLGGDWCKYWQNLETITGSRTFDKDIGEDCYCMLHATAAQRAEAFLRTVGKWKY